MSKTAETIMAGAIAKAEEEIKKAKTEGAIYEALPVKPARIFIYPLYGSVASVTYEVETKQAAYAIYSAFEPLPAFICKGSSTSIKPADDGKAAYVTEIHAWVKVDQHGAALEFYAQSPAGVIRVDVELPTRLFGHYSKSDWNARIHFRMDWEPLPKTNEMFRAVTYAPAYSEGPQSGKQSIYALYDRYEVANQFEGDITP